MEETEGSHEKKTANFLTAVRMLAVGRLTAGISNQKLSTESAKVPLQQELQLSTSLLTACWTGPKAGALT